MKLTHVNSLPALMSAEDTTLNCDNNDPSATPLKRAEESRCFIDDDSITSSENDTYKTGMVHSLNAAVEIRPDTFPQTPQVGTGILVHGCHLQADAWEKIVWGEPPYRLGRIPHTALLAWQERDTLQCISVGTGASSDESGLLEGEVTLKVLLDRIPRLAEFDAFKGIPLDLLEVLLRRTAKAETVSQNTVEEVREGLSYFKEKGCSRAMLVSSPTHLPRCLSCASVVTETERDLFKGSILASPCDTSYHNSSAADVVVVEPPHRGDRDRRLDDLPFHTMVKRSFKVGGGKREEFLKRFESLLEEYGA